MKLANSWAEEAPTTIASKQLYDELDECDEVDESKDGCGGACWWKYVLKKPHTSNRMLLELARDVRGVEIKQGKPLTVHQYKTIFSNWEDASRPFLRKGHDYFTEFLAKLSSVTMPKGETLESAFQRSERRQPRQKCRLFPIRGCGRWQAFVGSFKKCSATSLSCCAKRALRSCSKYHSKRSRSGFVH